jgi:hypothetical protein
VKEKTKECNQKNSSSFQSCEEIDISSNQITLHHSMKDDDVIGKHLKMTKSRKNERKRVEGLKNINNS